MKTKVLLFIIGFTFVLNTQAQKIVALHTATGVQFFSDDNPLQSAYAAATDNDTIYLPGGSFAPPQVFEKKLTIYGVGHYPSATTATFKTLISGSIRISDEADGFYLEGVVVNGNISLDTNESVNDVVIKRCKMNNLSASGNRSNPSENCIFQENVIGGVNSSNLLNSNFFNNIIQGTVNEARNLTFLNNLFLFSDTSGYTVTPVFGYANSCMFKNNVFLQQRLNVVSGSGQSTYSHNIFSVDTSGGGLGTDPILDTNYTMNRADILVNQTGGSFDYTHDYHLTAAAQANPGDDGTDCGIYGGFYPWKDESIPVTPHISSKNISNTTQSDGTIHIDINVHAQDR